MPGPKAEALALKEGDGMGMLTVMRPIRRILLAVGVCAALMALPATAAAQDALSNPAAAQYIPQSQVQGSSGNGSAAKNSTPTATATPTATEGAGGTLPFTGMDLAVVGGVALALIASGLGLRWLSAPRSPGVY
jgi:hypothetical protein